MEFYKILAIVSPFISALLTGFITYNLTMKQKRFDLLYQSKIPAFKDLSVALINYKNYCLGKASLFEAMNFLLIQLKKEVPYITEQRLPNPRGKM